MVVLVTCKNKEDPLKNEGTIVVIIYPTKKKRNSKIFALRFPFNAKMLIVIKYYVLIKYRQNSSVA